MNTAHHTRTHQHARPHTLRTGLKTLSLSIALACSLAPAASWAQESPVSIDIAAQPLGKALLQLGQQTPLQIFFSQDVAAGLNARPVSGNLEPEQALRQLLEGTGIRYVRDGNSITLSRPPVGSRPTVGGTVTLAPVTVTAERAGGITSEGTHSYAATGASIFKGAQSLKEIPQTVSVITQQRIEDQNLTDLPKIMEQAPGIYVDKQRTGTDASSSGGSIYNSRGFAINNYMIDGVTSNATTNLANTSVGISGSSAVYDRVEILRGAPGLLVGNGNPSGTVNLVRKRPTADFQQRYTLAAGSWNNYRGEADVSGPLNNAGTLRGRMVVAYEDKGRFWEGTDSQAPLFYGIAEADLSSATRISVGYQYEKDKENGSGGLYVLGETNFNPSRHKRYTPDWGYHDTKNEKLFFDLKHAINEKLEFALMAQHWNYDHEGVNPYLMLNSGSLAVYKTKMETNSIDANISGAFNAFNREHKVAFGFNASKQNRNTQGGTLATWNAPGGWPIVYSDIGSFNAEID